MNEKEKAFLRDILLTPCSTLGLSIKQLTFITQTESLVQAQDFLAGIARKVGVIG